MLAQLQPALVLLHLLLVRGHLLRREPVRTVLANLQVGPVLPEFEQAVAHREDAVSVGEGARGEKFADGDVRLGEGEV